MILLLWSLAADGSPLPTCGTPDHIADFAGVELAPTAPPVSDLVEQEAHGTIANVRYADRFALKWGPSFPLSEGDAERLLGDFEFAYSTMVFDWGMDDPTGVGGTYFNVYIGDTGGPVPSVMGAAGYYTIDAFGYPMIVLNKDLIGDAPYIRSVIAHEFFHGVQGQTRAYTNWETAAWYWEATACWAQGEAVPESNSYAGFLVFYAAQPHRGLYHFSSGDYGGAPPDYHQYGAFIFPRFLSEHLGAFDAVVDSWRDGDETGDPIRFLQDYLTEPMFDASFVDHAAHNLTWDYEDGDAYRGWVDGTIGNWPGADFRTTTLAPTPDADWYSSAEGVQLSPSSYTLVPIPSGWSDDGLLTVRFEQDGEPTADCSPRFGGRIIRLDDGEPTYIALSTTAEHDTASVGTTGELWLAIANLATQDECAGSAPFKVSFVRRDDPQPEASDTGRPDTGGSAFDTGQDGWTDWDPNRPDVSARSKEPSEPGGCACASSASTRAAWMWAVFPLLAIHRRRASAP